jgi:hypothetical protein
MPAFSYDPAIVQSCQVRKRMYTHPRIHVDRIASSTFAALGLLGTLRKASRQQIPARLDSFEMRIPNGAHQTDPSLGIVFSLDDNDNNAGLLGYSGRESFRQGGTTTTCPGAGFHDMGSLPIPSHWRSMVPRAMIPDGSRLLLNASTYWSAGQFKFVGKTPFMVPRPLTFRFV